MKIGFKKSIKPQEKKLNLFKPTYPLNLFDYLFVFLFKTGNLYISSSPFLVAKIRAPKSLFAL